LQSVELAHGSPAPCVPHGSAPVHVCCGLLALCKSEPAPASTVAPPVHVKGTSLPPSDPHTHALTACPLSVPHADTAPLHPPGPTQLAPSVQVDDADWPLPLEPHAIAMNVETKSERSHRARYIRSPLCSIVRLPRPA
jgi:hypothetical protein